MAGELRAVRIAAHSALLGVVLRREPLEGLRAPAVRIHHRVPAGAACLGPHRGGGRSGPGEQRLAPLVPLARELAQHPREAGSARVIVLAREVAAGEEGITVRGHEHVVRAAAAGEEARRELVGAVDVRALLPIHLDVDLTNPALSWRAIFGSA
jgi:hypothetical protein